MVLEGVSAEWGTGRWRKAAMLLQGGSCAELRDGRGSCGWSMRRKETRAVRAGPAVTADRAGAAAQGPGVTPRGSRQPIVKSPHAVTVSRDADARAHVRSMGACREAERQPGPVTAARGPIRRAGPRRGHRHRADARARGAMTRRTRASAADASWHSPTRGQRRCKAPRRPSAVRAAAASRTDAGTPARAREHEKLRALARSSALALAARSLCSLHGLHETTRARQGQRRAAPARARARRAAIARNRCMPLAPPMVAAGFRTAAPASHPRERPRRRPRARAPDARAGGTPHAALQTLPDARTPLTRACAHSAPTPGHGGPASSAGTARRGPRGPAQPAAAALSPGTYPSHAIRVMRLPPVGRAPCFPGRRLECVNQRAQLAGRSCSGPG